MTCSCASWTLLPDTRDAVRTHALSRRWRGLWTGVAALSFDSYYNASEVCMEADATEWYLAFVNDALALRAKATRKHYAAKDLAIWFDISRQQGQELVPPSVEAAQGWIRYAVQNEVKSLTLQLDLPWHYTEHPEMAIIDDLATSAKLETLHLRLGYAQLELFSSASSTVVFASLTFLFLGDIMVDEGDLLSRLVSSSCCPSLRKLYLSDLRFSEMEELLFTADALLELSMEMMDKVQSLELRTPSLGVLFVRNCWYLERFKVSAPRLENLTFLVRQQLHIDDVHGHLSSVATLKIQLSSHGNSHNDENDGSFDILKCCRLTRSLEVSLNVVETKYRTDDMIKGRIPPLPHVTSLTLHVTLREPHFFGSGIASFLAQCSSIRYLRLQLCYLIVKKDLLEQDLM